MSIIDPAVTVTEIWRMLERDFGESSAAGVIGLLTKFVGTLTSDYRHVGDHFKAMSALRNRINAESVKCFGEPIVSEQLVGALFLSLLPQQYFGSSGKLTKDSFTMDNVPPGFCTFPLATAAYFAAKACAPRFDTAIDNQG
ncbi:hypothetical protein H257_00238 [Aphanomyces astaci]|uniref:Uncharacterized protein n=1 Tax=Aphanomyces astaci TaxID=112090 RepID=W4HBS3_APHAT|nr:hypothetical protein H257_00238 [Aphanomyces astaci]ETV88719.1 hypothetical protein H257_00238 [Aphanomyces astaci]|eukprot:XP_009821119.1 hypothetical protein H257_00238 [Aphanomyces astaci]